jgi:hypothetical protein
MNEESPISEKLLQVMHSMGLVGPTNARATGELGSLLKVSSEEAAVMLADHEKEGHVASFLAGDGYRKYYLTGKGILKACSQFT